MTLTLTPPSLALLLVSPLLWLVVCGLGQAETIQLLIVDDLGNPVPDAKVSYDPDYQAPARFTQTDAGGRFFFEAPYTLGFFVTVSKKGYYTIRRNLGGGLDMAERLIMPRVLEPNPDLLVRFVSLKVPGNDVTFGYDMVIGDMVAPHGTGKIADMTFCSRFVDTGKMRLNPDQIAAFRKRNPNYTDEMMKGVSHLWNHFVDVNVPGEGNGIIRVRRDYLPYADLELPYHAYEKGYMPGLILRSHTGPLMPNEYMAINMERGSLDQGVGYFLRLRTQLDEDGNITSCHYAKICKEVRFLTDHISFTAVYNPKPFDRNLETFYPESPEVFNEHMKKRREELRQQREEQLQLRNPTSR